MLLTKFATIPSSGGSVWLDGWSYGKKLTIPASSVDADLSNFPLPVYLDSTNFDFTKCKADGSDIRFTDKSLNLLKFERKEHNVAAIRIATATTGAEYCYYYKQGLVTVSNTTVVETEIKVETSGSTYAQLVFIRNGSKNAGLVVTATSVICNALGTSPYTYILNTTSTFVKYKIKLNFTNNAEYYVNDVLIHTATYANLPTDTLNYIDWGDGDSSANKGGSVLYKSFKYNIDFVGNPTNFISWDSATLPTTQGWSVTQSSALSALTGTNRAVYNVQIPTVTDATDTEVYMWYGNASAYNASMEAHQDMTGKALTYNGDVKLVTGVQTGKRVASFDGTGDSFSLADLSDWKFGTGDFCVEVVAKPTALAGTKAGEQYITSMQTNGFLITLWNNNVHIAHGGVVDIADFASTSIANGTVANTTISRSGTSLRCFVDGVQIGSAITNSSNYTGSALLLGIGGGAFNGSIYGLRITKGSARYTANFTPPTTFAIDSANVVLCTNFDTIYDANYVMVQHMGTSLVDASGNNNSGTATGTTVVDTAYGKARSFNGTSDKIQIPYSASLNMGTSNMTALALFNAVNFTGGTLFMNGHLGSYSAGYSLSVGGAKNSSGMQGGGSTSYKYLTGVTTLSAGNYHTGAFKRSGDTIYGNVNGSAEDNLALLSGQSTNNTYESYIGAYYYGSLQNWMNGTIAETRISNIARSDAWIKAESLGLKNTLIKIENVYEVLADITVQSATTSVDFTGLNLGKGDEIMLVCDLASSSGDSYNYLYVNNNTTATNYYTQELHASSTTVWGNRTNSSILFQAFTANYTSETMCKIKLTNSGYFVFQADTVRNYSGSNVDLKSYYGTSTFTSTSITQLTVTNSVTNGISAGSRLQLYRIGRAI